MRCAYGIVFAAVLTPCAIVAAQDSRAVARRDSVLVDSVVAIEKRFLATWDTAWQRTQAEIRFYGPEGGEYTGSGTRAHNFHCHPELAGVNTAVSQGRLIKSEHSHFSVCPSWDMGEVRSETDERVWLDTALDARYRSAVFDMRQSLIMDLDSVAHILPENAFIAGQRIRFLVDQRADDDALRAARDCRAASWWCAALAGYVYATRGDVMHSDSAFVAATAAMPREERCRWNDANALLDSAGRREYSQFSCAKRDSVNQRLWWLADPLFIEPGNERMAEQNARYVLLALHTALDHDERYDWRDKIGGDARKAMVVRYGWPSQVVWGGPYQDRAHTGYLASYVSQSNEPYTTYEYANGHVHTVPAWLAIRDPFHAKAADWAVSEPTPTERIALMAQVPQPRPGTGRPVEWNWWPAEHFAPSRPLVQLPDGQHAMLRRQTDVLLAVATDLTPDRLNRQASDTVGPVALVVSSAPGQVRRVTESRGVVGSPLVMHGSIEPTPVLVGVEFAAVKSSGPPGGRLRFGVTPPPPLSAMRAGDIAISDPVLLRVSSNDAFLPNDAEGAIALMATSLRNGSAGRLGVYWETYGFQPADSVEIAVWIERYTNQGIVRRFGIALRVATDLNTPVSMSWKEPASANRTSVINGPVTIIGRSVIVDTSKLMKGDYWLDVAVRKAGHAPVRSRTTFVVP